ALEINVPKTTLWEWDIKHQNQILRLKKLQRNSLNLLCISGLEDALGDSLYNHMSPACLLQMALQIRGRLARMREQASVHNPEPNELYPGTGCITRSPYDQFADDDLVVDSPQRASDSQNQNRTK